LLQQLIPRKTALVCGTAMTVFLHHQTTSFVSALTL